MREMFWKGSVIVSPKRMAQRSMGLLDSLAHMYARSVGKRLSQYGLRYEDLLIESPEVLEATRRLPPAELDDRTMRWARAQHLDMKKKSLTGEELAKANQEAFKPYLAPYVARAQLESQEKLDWK